jgi:hypothetical protein
MLPNGTIADGDTMVGEKHMGKLGRGRGQNDGFPMPKILNRTKAGEKKEFPIPKIGAAEENKTHNSLEIWNTPFWHKFLQSIVIFGGRVHRIFKKLFLL